MSAPKRIVIVGGGFAGMNVALHLNRTDTEVVLIDKRNFHLFQPLLYQVATGTLSPGNIASPLRALVRKQKNVSVVLGEVTGVDTDSREVILEDGRIAYDALILATGAPGHHYFGNPEWGKYSPGLKTVEDATHIRSRILLAFEAAERESDPEMKKKMLTFAIVGAGPTGVELAGAIAEIARLTLPGEFSTIDPKQCRVMLVEGLDRPLPMFPEELSEKAKQHLDEVGVELHLNSFVRDIDADGFSVEVDDEMHRYDCRNVLWAGGVQASPIGGVLCESGRCETDKQGRVKVNEYLQVPGLEEVYVIGDLAHAPDENGDPLPGLAAVATQQGRYIGRSIKRRHAGKPVEPFRYKNKGILATIGKSKAVADFGKTKLSGFTGWITWLIVHLILMMQYDNRLMVLVTWFYSYFTNGRNARMITHAGPTQYKRDKREGELAWDENRRWRKEA
ncbi:NAD(P)/FAD-dependent oxidoreductase [bacterium]|nr:NAD(P)/FAD-dependent oxidoreductase [bacterium]